MSEEKILEKIEKRFPILEKIAKKIDALITTSFLVLVAGRYFRFFMQGEADYAWRKMTSIGFYSSIFLLICGCLGMIALASAVLRRHRIRNSLILRKDNIFISFLSCLYLILTGLVELYDLQEHAFLFIVLPLLILMILLSILIPMWRD